jgi:chromosome partitioning protein
MNTKGGVGKSTLVLALAETLSADHKKNVLIIDSDAQASISSMLMTAANLHKLQSSGLTIVDLLVSTVLNRTPLEWSKFVVGGVSDVDDARSIYLLPSDMQLTLLEREISKESMHTELRRSIASLLNAVRSVFDVVLIDCPPGLSVLTESWLREADFHISPTKADYVSVSGLEVFRRFKGLNPEMGFADNLGVVVNMFDAHSLQEGEYEAWLRQKPDNRCFTKPIPRASALQHAVQFSQAERSYFAKYPGDAGTAVRSLTQELLDRMASAPAVAREPAQMHPPAEAPASPTSSVMSQTAASSASPAQASAPRTPPPVPPQQPTPSTPPPIPSAVTRSGDSNVALFPRSAR